MQHIVVFTGAGMSAESGLKTFRDEDGLWENHDIYEVATPEAWQKNPELVNCFYNMRRKQLFAVNPNPGHFAISSLEKAFKVTVVTQNIDDLHERAGTTNVLHLHGELKKVKSSSPSSSFSQYLDHWEVKMGQNCPDGYQLRPDVVWFGEAVPNYPKASEVCLSADALLVVGTSLNVYPAAGLVHDVGNDIPIFLVDPKLPATGVPHNVQWLQGLAAEVLPDLVNGWLSKGILA